MGDPMLSTLSIVLAVVLGGIFFMWGRYLYGFYSRGSSKPSAALPKGSLGWPIIGETLAMIRDPREFVHSRVKRYGSVFKTHFALKKVIVGTTPEFAKFIYGNSKLFPLQMPKQVMELMGAKSFPFQDGPRHASVRKLVLRAIGAEALRNHVHAFETIILENLASWAQKETVVGKYVTQELTWDTTHMLLFGNMHRRETKEGLQKFENFKQILVGTSAIPLNVPGTTYNKAWKAKKALMAYFNRVIEQTKSEHITQSVFFEGLLTARDDPEGREELKNLDDAALADNMFIINLVAYDTTSTTLIWILKLLDDNPDVFRRIQAEQLEILKSKDPSVKGPRLTWEDTRKMVYSHKFLQELQRYVTIVPFVSRVATEDVNFGGYLIPRGWSVFLFTKFLHSDTANYPDLSFNPDRFDTMPKPYTNMPFSLGPHMCPGIEMAKLTSLIFIHYITTTYIAESAAPATDELEYHALIPCPKGGFPFKLRQRN